MKNENINDIDCQQTVLKADTKQRKMRFSFAKYFSEK